MNVQDLLCTAVDEEDKQLFKKACDFSQYSAVEVKAVPTSTGASYPLTEGDFSRIKPGRWGNDNLVNALFYILQNDDNTRSAISQQRPSLFLPSNFAMKFHDEFGNLIEEYGGLDGDLITQLQRWFRGVNILDLEFIFIPVKTGVVGSGNEHWYLVVVHVPLRTITCIDSIAGTSRMGMMLRVRDFVVQAEETKLGESASTSWEISEAVAYDSQCNLVCPQQSNGSDCAYFTLTAAEFTCRRLPLLYSQAHMGTIRMKVCARLFSYFADSR